MLFSFGVFLSAYYNYCVNWEGFSNLTVTFIINVSAFRDFFYRRKISNFNVSFVSRMKVASILLFCRVFKFSCQIVGELVIHGNCQQNKNRFFVWFMSFGQCRASNDEFSVECLFWFFQLTWKANLKVVQITKNDFVWDNSPL